MNWHAAMTMDDQRDLGEDLRRQAKDWVVHMATGDVTEAELRAFERWRKQSQQHADAHAQACRLWGMLGAPLEVAARPKEGRTTVHFPGFARPIGRRAFLGGALAASAAAVAVATLVRPPLDLWPSLAEISADYRTGIGEQRKIAFADRGSLEMNTRTSLNILPATAEKAETIDLIAGEAAVVAGPRTVLVQAAGGRVSAAEAQFTVRYDDAQVRVTCLAGSVDVECNGRMTTVRPRQQVTYTAHNVSPVAAVDPEIVAGWRDGLLIFDNEPLSRVVEEVNRYRAGRIIVMNTELGRRRVSARFKIGRLDSVLTQFQEVFGAKVTTLGGGVALLT